MGWMKRWVLVENHRVYDEGCEMLFLDRVINRSLRRNRWMGLLRQAMQYQKVSQIQNLKPNR